MATLTLADREIETVFELLGHKENDLTYALGWAFARSPALTASVLFDAFGTDVGVAEVIALQQHDPLTGVTDIEIRTKRAHLIIEAKRGWVVPALMQLDKYAQRLQSSPVLERRLMALTECSESYAFTTGRLPRTQRGIRVVHRSWAQVVRDAERARPSSNVERRHLRELTRYLKGVMTVQDLDSNWVYCVSLGVAPYGTGEGWSITPTRAVTERNLYSYPYGWGSGWPKVPPNYIAFRWEGKVQDLRHVAAYEVLDDMHAVFPEMPSNPDPERPLMVLKLGPPIPMPRPLPSGAHYQNARFRVALDLLLTASTLQEALTETKRRMRDDA